MQKIILVILLISSLSAIGWHKEKIYADGDLWQADGAGQKAEWFRERKQPHRILYMNITTSDGRMHRLKNVELK